MSRFAFTDLLVHYDGVDMTPYIQTINGIKISTVLQDTQSFADVWKAVSPSGSKEITDIVFGGIYDDINNGPKTLWDISTLTQSPNDTPKTLKIFMGGDVSPETNTLTIPVHPKDFEIKFTRNGVHEYTATLAKGDGDVTST